MSGVESQAGSEDVVVKEVRIAARPETVFGFFTEPDKVTRWLCESAVLDPRPGGVCRQAHRDEQGKLWTMDGEFLEVTPPWRVVFTWTFEEGDLEPESSRVEVELRPDGEGTLLRLAHHGAAVRREDHEHGWSVLLPKLEAQFAS